MSYQVLARKWRPANFSQVAGQSHVLKSLINALDNERLHHAYLFTGTRGVGKTTLARILAKCLNCETGIKSEPCAECASCTEINEGRFIDLIEVDAASRTKVEDTRELLDNVQYSPSRGRFKVYLIDEVHMLSNHSFNALLKTLEEPPPHVKFLLATTDPQKLPITILSRCLQFNLKNLSPQLIADYLQQVLGEENIPFDEESTWQIAAAASGSMRDALTLVDQAISFCQGEITHSGVVAMLGVPAQQQVFALLSAMVAGQVKEVLNLVSMLAEQTPDYVQTLDSLLSTLHRIAVSQIAPGSIDNSFGDKQQVEELAAKFTPEDIQLFYQLGNRGRNELRMAADMQAAFEMLLIRMVIFSPKIVGDDLQPLVDADSEKAVEPGAVGNTENSKLKKKTEPAVTKADAPVPNKSAPAPVVAASATEEPPSKLDVLEVLETSEALKVEPIAAAAISSNKQAESENSLAINSAIDESRSTARKIKLEALTHKTWLLVFPQLDVSGIAANILANSTVKSLGGNTINLVLEAEQSAVFSADILPKLESGLSDYFGQPLKVTIAIEKARYETPAQLAQRLRKAEYEQIVEDFEQDGNVQQLLDTFSATLVKDSITSLEN